MTPDRADDLPALAIRRPWLVAVLNLLIVIAGLGAWLGVEVRELPNIDRPIVAVRADYPGAAPETLDELTQQMSASAAQAFEQKAGKLDATISDLSRSLSGLKTSLSGMEQTAQQVATLPGKLASAQQGMTKAADQLIEAATETRPRLWRQALGLILAFGCAVTWALYSVASRSLGAVPTAAVTVFCLATAGLSALAHLALEQTVWPATAAGWLSVLALGIGPVGIAFFTWDIGMKKGDIQLLGVASYAAPLLSTLALVLAGFTAPSWTLLIAAVLIAGGAALAARANRPEASTEA